ncbi:MAG: DMT family transporter [Bacteroidales bacterium]|nr:DMT family transporter [Bacteroidales bacterium]
MKAGKLIGHLAAAGAYAIFGFNIVFCKDIANSGAVPPMVFFTLRAGGAVALFWLLSLFLPREKVSGRDLLRMVLASFLGLFVPQASFLFAIGMATSIDTAVLGSLTPVYTMCFAFAFLHEPITFKKAGGVAMSLAGVLLLIFNSAHAPAAVDRTQPLGVLLLLVNGLSFAAYLGAFRPLISRYSVVTLMKWMFLFSLALALPFSVGDLLKMDFASIAPNVGWEIAYVVFFATFVAYFLIPVGQKRLRPTLVSLYSYLQPMIATALSIAIGMDRLSWQKALAAALVFSGLVLVSRSRAAAGTPDGQA